MAKNLLRFRRGYAEEILKTSPKVDVIVFIHVISVLPCPARILELAMTKLKPKGRVMLYVNTRKSRSASVLNPLTRLLGFQFVKINNIVPKKYRTEKAGALNTCYIIEK